jgi:hypothetical protein
VLITNRQPFRLPRRHIHDHIINACTTNTHSLAPITTTKLTALPVPVRRRAPLISRLYQCVLLTSLNVYLPVSVPRHNTTAESSSTCSKRSFMISIDPQRRVKRSPPTNDLTAFSVEIGLLDSSTDQCLHLRCRSALLSLLKADDNTNLSTIAHSRSTSSNVAVDVSICSIPVSLRKLSRPLLYYRHHFR